MLTVNEARFLVKHKSCKCKCGLNESVYYPKKKWNHDECRCECTESDESDFCKNDYMWNPSACDY